MSFASIPVLYLPKIGPRKAEVLQQELDISTYQDLLYYFPFRYIDRRRVYKIAELNANMAEVQVIAVLRSLRQEGQGKKVRIIATCSDGTGLLQLIWFKGLKYVTDSLVIGRQYLFFGKPVFYNSSFQITHPEIAAPEKARQLSQGLQAVYRTSERMKRSHLDSSHLHEAILRLLHLPAFSIEETIEPELAVRLQLMPLGEALHEIHCPTSEERLWHARRRIKFDELLYLQLYMRQIALTRKEKFAGYIFEHVGELFNRFYHSLPFELTSAQKKVIREMRIDTHSGAQMNRLLQGDVGSGKTLVALMMMLLSLDNGHQACLMAPTEILAQQHYATLCNFLGNLPVRIALLTGSTPAKERRLLLEALSCGNIDILVGTHALIEPGVIFSSLGLAIIDEQHRFGVMQRARLWGKNLKTLPHVLIMSATPIPRTLAMTVYGDLDVSIIDELPPGRQPISTSHHYDTEIDKIMRFIRDTIVQGQQVYVVYPMIEGSEESDYKNITVGYEQFCHSFGAQNVTFVHGKLTPTDKQERMARFAAGEVPILLSTTVIEVGVNVPNATVMVIFDAQRFGLSQLHQLRGRVGRGADKSYCLLVTKATQSPETLRRIQVMVDTQDGFVVAEEDMKLRGFGDLEGTRQSGDLPGLKIANPVKDMELVQLSRQVADYILHDDPTLSTEAHHCYHNRLAQIKNNDLDLSNIS